MASMPGSSRPRLFSAKMRARPTVAGPVAERLERGAGGPRRGLGRRRRVGDAVERLRDRVEAVEHGLAAELGLAARRHRVAGGGDEARELGRPRRGPPLRRLGHRHQAGGQQRAVGGARRPGEGLGAAQQRLAEVVRQLRRRLGDQRHAAGHRDAEIAVAERAVGGVQPVELPLHRRFSRSMAGSERGAVDGHRTLQKAQSQGAFRSASSSSSSRISVKDTPAISIEVA